MRHRAAGAVDRHRLAQLGDQAPRDLPGLRVEADAGADGDGVARRGELGHDLARLQPDRARGRLGQRLGHRLQHQARDDRLLAERRRDRDQPASGAHRGRGAQRGRAGLAERPGHQQEVAVGPLVGAARTRRKMAPDVARLEEKRRDPACDLDVGHADRNHPHASGQRRPRAGDQAALEPGERQGQHRLDGGCLMPSIVRRDARGDIERDDRPRASVDERDRPRDVPFRRAAGAGAQERVDHDVGPREPSRGRRVVFERERTDPGASELRELPTGVAADLVGREGQHHRGPRAVALEPARHDEAVAPVAALAADHDHPRAARGRAQLAEPGDDRVGGAAPGVLHQGRARNAQLGDRAPVEPPHLLGGEDTLHGDYFPAGSETAWTRKSARIAV